MMQKPMKTWERIEEARTSENKMKKNLFSKDFSRKSNENGIVQRAKT